MLVMIIYFKSLTLNYILSSRIYPIKIDKKSLNYKKKQVKQECAENVTYLEQKE